MDETLLLEIVTPEEIAHSEKVQMVTLPGIEGIIGILPGHEPLMTRMVPGELVIRKGGQDTLMAVGEGLVEITSGRVAILTDLAIEARDIDEAKAEESRRRAAARLREQISAEETAAVNASLARALAQLSVKRRHRT